MADGCREAHQIGELGFVLRVENALFRAHAEGDFLAALKISRIVGDARLGEFEAVAAEGNRRGREDRDFHLGQNGANARD